MGPEKNGRLTTGRSEQIVHTVQLLEAVFMFWGDVGRSAAAHSEQKHGVG